VYIRLLVAPAAAAAAAAAALQLLVGSAGDADVSLPA